MNSEYINKENIMKHLIQGIITTGLILGTQAAQAAPLTIPNTFTANTPAVAADVNANFTASKTAVDDNDARIKALESVTNSNNSVLTMQKAAGNWGIIINAFFSTGTPPNAPDFGREVDGGTMVLNSDGTFTITTGGGNAVTIGLGTTTNNVSNATTNTFTGKGTVTATGNRLTAIVKFTGGSTLNLTGFISQNGQVMIFHGKNNGATENEIIMMVKIN